jgi:hypothetical protein
MDLDTLSPEQMQQLLRLGTLNRQDDIIQQEIERAMAQGQPSKAQHTTGIGALFGGMGDAVRGVGSELRQRDLRGQQQANLDQEEQARNLFAQLLRRQGGGTLDAGIAPLTPMGGGYG